MKTRTLHLNVNFGMTIVADADAFEQIAKHRKEARGMSPEKLAELDKAQAYRHSVAVSDKTDEELLVIALRTAMRDTLRHDLPREVSGDGLRASTGDVKVTVTPKKAAAPKIDCIACRVLATCGRTYKCSTCRNMTEVK